MFLWWCAHTVANDDQKLDSGFPCLYFDVGKHTTCGKSQLPRRHRLLPHLDGGNGTTATVTTITTITGNITNQLTKRTQHNKQLLQAKQRKHLFPHISHTMEFRIYWQYMRAEKSASFHPIISYMKEEPQLTNQTQHSTATERRPIPLHFTYNRTIHKVAPRRPTKPMRQHTTFCTAAVHV